MALRSPLRPVSSASPLLEWADSDAIGVRSASLAMITLFGKPEPTLLEKLKQSVSKTRTELSARIEQLAGRAAFAPI
jgi:hypothetical protein